MRPLSVRPPTNPATIPIEGADEDRDQRGQEADRHRDPRPVDRQVEHVAPELVGPEDVGRRRRLERPCPVAVVTVSSGPTNRCGAIGEDGEDDEDDQPDDAVAALAEPPRRTSRAPATAQPPSLARGRSTSAPGRRGGRSRPHPRIEEAVDEVGAEVGHDDGDRQEQEDPLEHRVVAAGQRVDGQGARGPAS